MTLHKKIGNLQKKLENIFDFLIENRYETGLQAVVYYNGSLVTDVNCGTVSSKSEKLVTTDTLFPVCSTGKGIVATLVNILVDQGRVELDELIVHYWPEYGIHGKEKTTVRQALSHQAGIPQPAVFDSFAEFCDWDAACNKMADLKPKWTPGTTMEYHSLNWGWIIGGIIERATGCSFRQLLQSEITGPLALEKDIYFGIDAEAKGRVSLFEIQPKAKEQVSTAHTKETEIPGAIHRFVNRTDVMTSCMPACNGVMTAKGIAKVYASLLGKCNNIRLLSDEQLDQATTLQTPINVFSPPCFGHGIGLGYSLKGPKETPGLFFGHGGAGGSEGMGIRSHNISFGFTKNRYDTHIDAPSHTLWLFINELKKIIGGNFDGGFYFNHNP